MDAGSHPSRFVTTHSLSHALTYLPRSSATARFKSTHTTFRPPYHRGVSSGRMSQIHSDITSEYVARQLLAVMKPPLRRARHQGPRIQNLLMSTLTCSKAVFAIQPTKIKPFEEIVPFNRLYGFRFFTVSISVLDIQCLLLSLPSFRSEDSVVGTCITTSRIPTRKAFATKGVSTNNDGVSDRT